MSTNYTWEDYSKTAGPDAERTARKGFIPKVKSLLGKFGPARKAVEMYYCAIDSKVPLYVKSTAFIALAYFVMPLDLIPDIIPIVGYTDDAAAVLSAYTAISAFITDEHRKQADEFFGLL